MNTLPPKLIIAIESLYKVFSRYKLEDFGGCPCCVGKSECKYLQNKPLRDLTGAELSRYAFKAMTTWGDENDFRYFLPRIFELVASDELGYTDYEVTFGKLEYAKWQTWAGKEQVAINNYFRELMEYAFEFGEEADVTTNYFSGIARAVEDVTPYLILWLEPLTKNRILTLRYFVIEDSYGSENPFLCEKQEQRKQIIDWLIHPQTVEKLEDAFFHDESFTDSKNLAELIDAIHNLKKSVLEQRI